MFCVNPWKRLYINTSVSEDCDSEGHNGSVPENGAYDGSSRRVDVFSQIWEEHAQLYQLWEPSFHPGM